jgi:hypothetical protein
MAEVLLLSGPPSSGKTTVSKLLSECYDRVDHVDVNTLWRFLAAGRFEPWSAEPESAHQQNQAVRQTAYLAHDSVSKSVGVIIEDVITPELLTTYVEALQPGGVGLHFERLMPDLGKTCLTRNQERLNDRAWPG